jgi:hypothetical protein
VDLALAGSTFFTNVRVVTVLHNTTDAGMPPSFDVLPPIPTGTDPVSLVAADFDNDGRVDLALAGLTFPTNVRVVTVLQNTTDAGMPPSFDVLAPIPTGTNPVSLVAADFDNDGLVDLAIPGLITGTNERVVTVLQNTSSCAPGPFAGTGKVIVTGNAVLAADWTSQLPPRFPAEPVLNSLPRQWLFEPPLDRGLTVQDPLEPALLSGTAATAPRPRPPLEPGFADLDGSMLVDAVPKDLPLARLGAAGAPLDHDSTTP